jgi:hypothetical protein
VLIFLASFSNSSKFSYLDGVPFAINPIFLNENQQEKFAKTESLNYNLNNSLAVLNSKVNFKFFKRLYN